MSDIGKKIHDRRIQLGLTLEQVGEAVGVGKSTVRKWENGMIKNMGSDKIAKLANVLQMNPVEFVPGNTVRVIGTFRGHDSAMPLRVGVQSGKLSRIGKGAVPLGLGTTQKRVIFVDEDPQLAPMMKLWKVSSPKTKTAAIEILKLMNEKED